MGSIRFAKGVLLIINDKDNAQEKQRRRRNISAAAAACAALIFAVLSGVNGGSYIQGGNAPADRQPEQSAEVYEDTPGEETVIVTVPPSYAAQPEEVAAEDVLPETVSGNTVLVNGEPVGVVSDKGRLMIESHVEAVSAECLEKGEILLDAVTFEPGEFDPMEISSAAEISALIELRRMTVHTESEVSVIEAETVYQPSRKLFVGSSLVETEGEDGELITVYKVTEINGEAVSREEIAQIVSVAPADTVILEGAREKVYLTAEQLAAAGDYIFPLTGSSYYISSEFGYRGFDNDFHNGTDYAADMGTPVYAACDGTVIFSGWDETGFGNYILLEHSDNFKTGYAHLSEIFVESGAEVTKGDLIGAVGSTGNSTGNHLHLVVKYDDQYVDPTSIY